MRDLSAIALTQAYVNFQTASIILSLDSLLQAREC